MVNIGGVNLDGDIIAESGWRFGQMEMVVQSGGHFMRVGYSRWSGRDGLPVKPWVEPISEDSARSMARVWALAQEEE